MASGKKQILVCLDCDPQPSVFDSVAAVDAGVDHLFRHAGVSADAVRELVYGAIFTRGPDDLKRTAIFIGGSDVAAGEAILKQVQQTFFGPMRVSVMLDSNGANTTAAAAVLAVGRCLGLRGQAATVLAATGPVGQRVARLLAEEGAAVTLTSRKMADAEAVCEKIRKALPDAELTPATTGDRSTLEHAAAVVACGPPGVELISSDDHRHAAALRVAVDLNAVPPTGIAGLETTAKQAPLYKDQPDGAVGFGAIGVGGVKMKIHKAAVARLFEANDQVLDVVEIYGLAKEMHGG